MAEAAGSIVGHYRILAPIGSGGFATVYRARDERLGSEVAIKILAENHALDPEIRSRFLSEARLLRQVAGEHVITLFDVGETDRLQPYLVLGLATGGDLRRRVDQTRRQGRVATERDVTVVASALADALSALHRVGVVHRDVSPGNLLLVGRPDPGEHPGTGIIGVDERIVLADLGYAKDLTEHSGLTVGGGTSGFNAPEQRAGLGRIDVRADVYAAGAVMTWLLTGEVHDERHAADVLSGVAPGLRVALERSISERPDDRQADMATWAESLQAGLDADRPPAVIDEEQTTDAPDVSSTAERPRRRRWLAALTAGLVAVTAIVTIVAWSRSDDSAAVTTTLEDGRVRVARNAEGVQVAIFGPSSMFVDQPATFEAGITGGLDYFWLAPDGTVARTEPSIVVTAPDAADDAVLSLTVITADGTPVTVSRRVRVEN